MHQCSLKMDVLVNQRRNQLKLMNWQLQLNHQFNENNMLLLRVQQEYRGVQKKRRRRRSVWVRPWIERRVQLGQYTRLMEELRLEDVKAFKNFLRVEPELYEELVERVSHRIWKQDTAYRQSLRPGLKIAITMRYLASGDSYHSLMYAFRVPHNTISKFIPEVCEAITQEYSSEVIACCSRKLSRSVCCRASDPDTSVVSFPSLVRTESCQTCRTHWLFSAQPPSAPTPWTSGESPETSCGPCGRSRASPEATDSCRSPAVLRGLPTPLSRPSSVTCELASLVDQRQRQVEWRLSPQHQDQQVEQVEEESAPSVEAGGSPLQHLPLRWSWGLSGDFWTFSLLSPWMERSSLGKDVWDPSR